MGLPGTFQRVPLDDLKSSLLICWTLTQKPQFSASMTTRTQLALGAGMHWRAM